ncbi:reverse transcriptase domain-containing protein [Latilactobacillus curvatus]
MDLQSSPFKNNQNLIERFQKISDIQEMSDFFEVDKKILTYALYNENKYRIIKIKKHNGKLREIEAPPKNRTILQKKLAYVIQIMYTPNTSVVGFVKGRDVLYGAKKHINKRVLLNFDIKDFFPSIKEYRVVGVFKYYFKFNNVISGSLASLCTHNGTLTQGAATSPVLSNIILYQLDRKLKKLCLDNGCFYSRYVDDITISSYRNEFPKYIYTNDGISEEIVKIVESEKLEINDEKTRMSYSNQSQRVTGIVVNKQANVQRAYVNKIRSIMHNYMSNNKDEADKKFYKYYHPRHNSTKKVNPFAVIRGMINHVVHVKGSDSSVTLNLMRRFNELSLKGYKIEKFNIKSKEHVYIKERTYEIQIQGTKKYYKNSEGVTCNFEDDPDCAELLFDWVGSGFVLENGKLITCAHVFSPYLDLKEECNIHTCSITARIENDVMEEIELVKYNKNTDIAVCSFKKKLKDRPYFNCANAEREDNCILAGFPMINRGGLSVLEGKIDTFIKDTLNSGEYDKIQDKIATEREVLTTNVTIYEGNSGGPILNQNLSVIGIAEKGQTSDAITGNIGIKINDLFSFSVNNVK